LLRIEPAASIVLLFFSLTVSQWKSKEHKHGGRFFAQHLSYLLEANWLQMSFPLLFS
jgi:hypothetical protein